MIISVSVSIVFANNYEMLRLYVNLPKMNDFLYILNTLFTFKLYLLMWIQIYCTFIEICIIHMWYMIYMTQKWLHVMLSKRQRYCIGHRRCCCHKWYAMCRSIDISRIWSFLDFWQGRSSQLNSFHESSIIAIKRRTHLQQWMFVPPMLSSSHVILQLWDPKLIHPP